LISHTSGKKGSKLQPSLFYRTYSDDRSTR
jgi:hypothetical protein